MSKSQVVLVALVVLSCGAAACDRSITVVEQTQSASDAGCVDCHSEANTALVAAEEQWLRSGHAVGATTDNDTPPCSWCHTSEGFVALTSGNAPPPRLENPTTIHCFTCHAPHTRADFSLRVAAPAALANGEVADLGAANICLVCHRSPSDVGVAVPASGGVVFDSDLWGPHGGAQADVFIGSNGYEYPLVPYFDGPHKARMPQGCLHCHFDSVAGNALGGHSFNVSWNDEGERTLNTDACNQDGCHSGLDTFDHDGVQSEVEALLATLGSLLVGAGLIDESNRVVVSRATSPDSAGAVWNYLMVLGDGSGGVHNPEYTRDLLGSSILFMGGTLP